MRHFRRIIRKAPAFRVHTGLTECSLLESYQVARSLMEAPRLIVRRAATWTAYMRLIQEQM
jgi:hypothetical protein